MNRLYYSPFATKEEMERFILWANEPGQSLTDWDKDRLEWAKWAMDEKTENKDNTQ